MENITIAPQQRKGLIIEMKRETKAQPQAEDAHSAARLRGTLAHRDRSRPLLLAHHRLRRSRPLPAGRVGRPSTTTQGAARGRCSPRRPTSASRSCWRRIHPPIMAGCARHRWSCKLIALQLFRERAAFVSRETVRRALHRLGFRWRRPRPVPPDKDSEEHIEEKHARLEDVLQMTEEAGSFFPGRDQAGDQPQGGLLLDAHRGNRSLCAPRGPTARCGFPGRSTSRRGVCTGSPGSAGTTNCS